MRKIFTMLAATTLFAGAAFADSVALPTVTFSSQDGVIETIDGEDALVLNSLDATVNINFSSTPAPEGAELLVYYAPGTADFTADMIPVTQAPIGNVLTLDLTNENWGEPYMGEYHLTLMVTWMDEATGDFFYNDDDELIAYQMPCVTPNEAPATFVYSYPNGTWEEGDNFASAYNRGEVTVAFSNPVTFENKDNIGSIKYYTTGGDVETSYIQKYSSDWNRLDGYWAVMFDIKNSEFSAEDLEKIVIDLNGVKSEFGGGTVPVKQIVLENTTEETPAPKKIKNRMANDLTNGCEPVNVYNVQGMLVKENFNKSAINQLPAGIYIVDGKKVIVR